MIRPQGQSSWRCFLVTFDRGDRYHSVRSLSASTFHRMRHTQQTSPSLWLHACHVETSVSLLSFSPFLPFYFLFLEIFILTFLFSCPSQQFLDHCDRGEFWDKALYPEHTSVLPCWLDTCYSGSAMSSTIVIYFFTSPLLRASGFTGLISLAVFV